MTSPAIALQECTVTTRKSATRLHETSLDIPRGEIVAVIGPNGAGKSTLMGLAAGLLKPTSGNVYINDRAISKMSARDLAQERAVLTQDQGMTFGFSVAEIVNWGRTPWQGAQRSREILDAGIVADALKTVGMYSERKRPINELSGGERKRVHLARIIAQQSSIALLDEPDSDLDLTGLVSLDQILKEMNSRGTTIIVTSHDLNRMSALSTRLVVVARGMVIDQGATREVLTSEVLSDAYGANVRITWNDNDATVRTEN